MNERKRAYHAIVWGDDPKLPGERVTVLAADLDDAQRQLEERYGKDRMFTLHNEEDADKPR
jgi:hypothetical protein